MNKLLYVWFRAFSIVACTALNVSQVAREHYIAAFFTGGVLSWIWWQNTKTAVKLEGKLPQVVYAFGAACGTISGMWLAGWING